MAIPPEEAPSSPRGEERWQVLSRMVEVRSPWLSLIGERLRDGSGQELEYWRVEKPDSLLVVTLHRGRLILPPPSYRPGVGRVTLDLAGGRLLDPGRVAETAVEIARREFSLSGDAAVVNEGVLNQIGWDLDSSTSSQRVFGACVELAEEVTVSEHSLGASYAATSRGGQEAISDLVCLQCRAVLQEWLDQNC
ncbi:MAG: NUDIX hydrolase [Acidimicrobiales bacterium]